MSRSELPSSPLGKEDGSYATAGPVVASTRPISTICSAGRRMGARPRSRCTGTRCRAKSPGIPGVRSSSRELTAGARDVYRGNNLSTEDRTFVLVGVGPLVRRTVPQARSGTTISRQTDRPLGFGTENPKGLGGVLANYLDARHSSSCLLILDRILSAPAPLILHGTDIHTIFIRILQGIYTMDQ